MSISHTVPADTFTQTQRVYLAVQSFAEGMQAAIPAISDGLLTARVVGEFSAGKTRLLRELLGDAIPPPLFPVSSLERQTRLQLEITHGETPGLSLIKRAEDYEKAMPVQTLAHFPGREELLDFDPFQYRLRLTLPVPQFILAQGDGFSEDTNPKRLLLIDTPGWNSGDDALAEREANQVLAGYFNLGLVYVSPANRLDGGQNAERLKQFLTALADAEFLGQKTLVFVLTHCPTADAPHLEARAINMVLRLWDELGHDESDLALKLFAVDFAEFDEARNTSFRADFWQALLTPIQQRDAAVASAADPWERAVQTSLEQVNVRALVQRIGAVFDQARALLQAAKQGDDYVAGMNMYRLVGLSPQDMAKKMRERWVRQLGISASDLNEFMTFQLPNVPPDHPLNAWWTQVWQPDAQQVLRHVQAFFRTMDEAIAGLTPETPDLQAHLDAQVSAAYNQAQLALNNTMSLMVSRVAALALKPVSPIQFMATVFSMGLMRARYLDHCEAYATTLGVAGVPE